MSTNKQIQEQISAMVDGELSDVQIDQMMALLRTPQGRAAWEDFHRIGDALRSDDMAFDLSDGFAERVAARIESEPAIVAPLVARTIQIQHADMHPSAAQAGSRVKRYAMSGAAAAAVAVAALMVAPKWPHAQRETAVASAPVTVPPVGPVMASVRTVASVPRLSSAPVAVPVNVETVQEGEMLRDARIDEYLLAHQRFSPSVFSSAQYARSATFANDSGR
jgi:sigma-E factor negative regulatory protein RseA